MERTDNLKVRYIENKMQFFGDLLNDTESIDDVITVDVVGYGVDVLGNCSTENVLKQCQDNRFIWIKKEHV